MAGGVAVGEVTGMILPDAPRETATASRAPGLDTEAVRALIRRDAQRRARLTVD